MQQAKRSRTGELTAICPGTSAIGDVSRQRGWEARTLLQLCQLADVFSYELYFTKTFCSEGRRTMRKVILAVFVIAMFGGANRAPAANAADETAVPMNEASFHVPVFQNDLVRLLNVNFPSGGNSGYHIHSGDLLTVVVEDSDTAGQVLGRPPNAVGHAPRGSVAFTTYDKPGLIHTVTNVGPTPFHLIAVELLYPQHGRFSPSSRAEVPGYVPVIDNDRVRGWRLILEPGQSVAAIIRRAPGLRIVVSGGEIAESAPGRADRKMALHLGEFYWQEPGASRGIHNLGTTRVELVEFELK